MGKSVVLIAGPTASGKSALAVNMAQKSNALIINADSMQVYSTLNVLSARPQDSEMAQAEHHLFGYVDPATRFSTGAWSRDVKNLLDSLDLQNQNLIFVGGTGLYFQALVHGFSEIPPVPPEVVSQIETEVDGLDREQRRALLMARDPEMALRLQEPDQQRLVRALSVLQATGRSLAHWQDVKQVGLLDGFDISKIVINPERNILRDRIATRFATMLELGAVEEVRQILALDLDTSLPVMKAIGVREVGDWLAGKITKERAIELAVIASQRYAKRQRTWFRKQMADWEWRE